jgi:hypothetical protein
MEAYGRGDYLRAVALLDKLPEGDSLASLYRASVSASARLRAGDTLGADRIVAAAQAVRFVAGDSVWTGHFHRLRMRTLSALPPGPRRDVLRAALKTPIGFVDRVATLHRLLEADTLLVARASNTCGGWRPRRPSTDVSTGPIAARSRSSPSTARAIPSACWSISRSGFRCGARRSRAANGSRPGRGIPGIRRPSAPWRPESPYGIPIKGLTANPSGVTKG